MKVELISYTKDPLKTIATAGAECYKTPINERTINSILDHCYESGHHSIFEFADFTFRISGVSRAITHQLVRHRVASYAQESQRYVDAFDADFYTPQSIKDVDGDSENKLFEGYYTGYLEHSLYGYRKLLNCGIPKEDARYVLPNATTSSIVIKMNLRSLMNFMNLRLCTRAQKEIRDIAKAMRHEVILSIEAKNEGNIRKYLVPKCERYAPYNFCTEKESCGRHKLLKEVYNGD